MKPKYRAGGMTRRWPLGLASLRAADDTLWFAPKSIIIAALLLALSQGVNLLEGWLVEQFGLLASNAIILGVIAILVTCIFFAFVFSVHKTSADT